MKHIVHNSTPNRHKVKNKSPLVFLISLVLMIFMILPGADLSNNPGSGIARVYASGDSNPSVIRLGTSAQGILTGEPVFLDDRSVVLPTSSGLYVISGGETRLTIPTSTPVTALTVTEDIDGDGLSDIAAATSHEVFPNVTVFSSENGKEIAKFKPSMLRYRDDKGWFQYQPPVTCLKSIEYKSGSGDVKPALLVASGYSACLVEASSGKLIWENVDRDNVWDVSQISDVNSDGINDFAAGGQRGAIRIIDGANGVTLNEKTISSVFQVKNGTGKVTGEIPRSVWQVSPYLSGSAQPDETNRLIAASEDGNLYMIDGTKCDILWKAEVYKYIDSLLFKYYGDEGTGSPTGLRDSNYRNIIFRQPGDVNGDGEGDIAAVTFFGQAIREGESNRRYNDRQQTIVMIDGKTGQRLWDVALSKLPPSVVPALGEINGKKYMLVPSGNTPEGIGIITAVDLSTGDYSLSIPVSGAAGGNVSGGGNRIGYILTADQSGGYLYTSTSLDMLKLNPELNGIDWILNRNESSNVAKIIEDIKKPVIEQENILLSNKWPENNPLIIVDSQAAAGSGKMRASDENSKLIFPDADFDNDGIIDLIIFRLWGERGPEIDILSGVNGKRIYRYSSFKDTSGVERFGIKNLEPACAVHDLNGDGKPELAVVKNLVYEAGIEVDILDTSYSEEKVVKKIIIQKQAATSDNDRFNPGIYIKEIKPEDGKYILVAAAIDGDADMRQRLYFIETDTGRFISGFDTSVANVSLDADGRMLAVSGNGEILSLDYKSRIAFENLSDKGKINSPAVVKWSGSSANSVVRVLIDGIAAAETDKNEVSVNLPSGTHEIKLEKLDMWGKREFTAIGIEVEKTSKVFNSLLLLTILSMFVLFITPLLLRKHFLRKVKIKGKVNSHD